VRKDVSCAKMCVLCAEFAQQCREMLGSVVDNISGAGKKLIKFCCSAVGKFKYREQENFDEKLQGSRAGKIMN
jgi:hypothetical protein